MARQVFSLLLVVALLVASSSAQQCIGTPSIGGLLSSGTPCDGAIPCASGLACDETSTCSAVKVGDACLDDSGCPFQSRCVGPPGKLKCVANAKPGGTCTSTLVSITNTNYSPYCPTSNGCVANVCIGGLGDSCSQNSDCAALTAGCSGNICQEACVSTSTSYCNYNQTCSATLTCTPLSTTGSCVPGSIIPTCSPSASCVATDLTNVNYHCVKYYSVPAGSFCNAHNQCASGLCFRNKCQAKSPDACQLYDPNTSSQVGLAGCVVGEVCTCSNSYLTAGYGTCNTDKCWSQFFALGLCVLGNCQTTNFDGTGNCPWNTCKVQYNAYTSCDPSQALWTLYNPF